MIKNRKTHILLAAILCMSMLFTLCACNKAPDGVSVMLTDQEYEEQLLAIEADTAMLIIDDTTPLTGTPDDEAGSTAQAFATQVLAMVNSERGNLNLPPLSGDNAALNAAAQARAVEIVTSFSHTRPNRQVCFTVLAEYQVGYRAAGENIAKGQSSPEAVMRSWMNSNGHRANIMNGNFSSIGIGVAQDARGVFHWVQLFTG